MYNTHDATNSLKKGRDYISQYKRYVITYVIGNEFTGFLQINQFYFYKTLSRNVFPQRDMFYCAFIIKLVLYT